MRGLLLTLLAIGNLPAQDLLWQIPSPPSTVERLWMTGFVDFDRDGYRDFLEIVYPNGFTNQILHAWITSGRDGSLLWSQQDSALVRLADGGDIDGDGHRDLLMVRDCCQGPYVRVLRAYSLHTGQPIWENIGPQNYNYGRRVIGGLDVNGDGRSDAICTTLSVHDSTVFVYDSSGALLYSRAFLPTHYAISIAALGDLDDDGGDDFVVGTNDPTDKGELFVFSGRTGNIIRTSFGLQAGDRTSEHASSFGDLDADGYDDYGAFPYWSASRAMAVTYSGRTGQLLRTWPVYANSVVTGEDVDQDGVPDLVHGADWPVAGTFPQVYGSTRANSGRDGAELWRVDNFYGGLTQNNGTYGWMEHSACLGVQPGNPYPVIAWLDLDWFMSNTHGGRVRAYRTNFAGQSPVTGTACSTLPEQPLIGARQSAFGSRLTVAHAPPHALAWLNLALRGANTYAGHQLPLDLTPLGLPGCSLFVPPGITYTRLTGSNGINRGYTAVALPFHLTAATTGIDLGAQWLVFDPVTFDHAATAMHALRAQ
ncbi:MAG: VCBS repeat-containing protein [Planctomycetes bacterium]|nr:VCBS repeat-containing protein [Planctomycetota bacterium]